MACGLSYGELLPLCTWIFLGLVVHGVRVMPQTLGENNTELQVAEPEAKGVHLIQQKEAQGSCSYDDSLWSDYPGYSLHSANESFVPAEVSREMCGCECLGRGSKCRGYEVHADKCVLHWRNIASVYDSGGTVYADSGVTYYERQEVSGTEDFKGPFVGKTIWDFNFVDYGLVDNAALCADHCREMQPSPPNNLGCRSFVFVTSGPNDGMCKLSTLLGSLRYRYFGTDYYERREVLEAGVLGPFLGTMSYGFYLSYYQMKDVGSASSCSQKCQDDVTCQSFAFKQRTTGAISGEDYRCYLFTANRGQAVAGGGYKVAPLWDYYD